MSVFRMMGIVCLVAGSASVGGCLTSSASSPASRDSTNESTSQHNAAVGVRLKPADAEVTYSDQPLRVSPPPVPQRPDRRKYVGEQWERDKPDLEW